MYYEYLLFMLPAMALALGAQLWLSSTFKKYSSASNKRNLTGSDAARIILDESGLRNISVVQTSGNLTDHYDPTAKVIRLSQSVYDINSIAALGVAAHEAGHAVQHAEGYFPIKVRSAIIPICNIGAGISPYLLMLGLLFNIPALYFSGIIAFGLVTLFQLVTLPVEFNASHRALVKLRANGSLDEEELGGAKKVLTAAAMTYVAALFTSFMQLLYYLSRYNRNKR